MLLADALDRGAVVLTANQRAARSLEEAFAEDQRSLGIPAWPKPRILDWTSWVAELWEQHARLDPDTPLPLSTLQEHQLWKRVLGADRDRVVAPDRLAELAQQAYKLLGDYRAHPLRHAAAASPFGAPHEDAERFLAWSASFDRLCAQNGWLSRSMLEQSLTQSAEHPADRDDLTALGRLSLPPELCLVGFDRTTPGQAALIEALERAGSRVSRYSGEHSVATPQLLQARSQREELEACAWWCRSQLEADSSRRIGVIAPDLGRVRADLDRVFRRILMPQTTLWISSERTPDLAPHPVPDSALPYEFSLGASLGSVPAIRAALLVLRWLGAPLASAELTWLLTSGLLASSPADQLALAALDLELRRKQPSPEVSLSWVLSRARQHLPAELRARLLRLQARSASERLSTVDRESTARTDRRAGASDRRSSYAAWAELIPALLTEAGWPGYREADSYTFQARQRWTRLLAELAELGFDGSQPTWTEFLLTLEEQAHAVIFAAESTSAPIQVLGAFESSGQSFDALWFLGVDDTHWPAVGRPHPLLPAWLQREAKMPHASPEADWLLAQEATERICASAPVVMLSYPAADPSMQDSALRLSPLLRAYACTGAPARVAPAPTLRRVQLEALTDDSGTVPWLGEQSAGGSEVIKRQAACAFQSFAVRRLRAAPLDEPTEGLDAAERGIQLHAVLESLWSAQAGNPGRLHTHDDLARVTADGSLSALLARHIDAAFLPLQAEQPGEPWAQTYYAYEKQRLHERLTEWLACELTRRPFHVKALEEQVRDVAVGPLRLDIRLDRVDELQDGSHLLLDYKTGKVKTAAWMGERPEEPQLPLYALFGGVSGVSAVAFAQLRADKTELLARAEAPSEMVSESLGKLSTANLLDDAVRDHWRESLLALAEGFARGDAEVNPRDGLRTCEYCPLAGLCRIHATDARLQDSEGSSR